MQFQQNILSCYIICFFHLIHLFLISMIILWRRCRFIFIRWFSWEFYLFVGIFCWWIFLCLIFRTFFLSPITPYIFVFSFYMDVMLRDCKQCTGKFYTFFIGLSLCEKYHFEKLSSLLSNGISFVAFFPLNYVYEDIIQ